MTSPIQTPSWARMADVATASPWWAARRDIYPSGCLTPQAVLTLVGAVLRQGQALLLTATNFEGPADVGAWCEDIVAAWEMALVANAHLQNAQRTPDGTPAPSLGLVMAQICDHDWVRWKGALADHSASVDVSSALLCLEAAYQQALSRLFGASKALPGEVAHELRALLFAVGGVIAALDQGLPWFAPTDVPLAR